MHQSIPKRTPLVLRPAWLCLFLSFLTLAVLPLISAESGPKEQHWAFQPLAKPPVPSSTRSKSSPEESPSPIDAFIVQRLSTHGLSLNPPADRVTLIRRLYLDVLGLPPSPEEVRRFVQNRSDRACEELVDHLLASPHYGERWARHWLDIVRFAESNGFETNTPRKNAWPYRDWIIRVLNSDLPYDQFVSLQLAGDAFGADAATGFLVGGAWDEVKSPDITLTTQQRMDELHDMVATTGSAFLGLTVGCARCHNHKFDPISQKDYYAVQAIFAGVQHGERPIPAPDAPARKQRADALKSQLAQVERELAAFEPIAWIRDSSQEKPAVLRSPVNAKYNIDRIQPTVAKYLRFEVLETSTAEPCLDELEVYTAGQHPANIALAAHGTRAAASSVYPNSDIHKLEHINDGRHGNGRSWISNEPGKGSVELEFPEAVEIERIVWGRDREETFADRLATRYQISVAAARDVWRIVATSHDRAPFDPSRKKESTPVLSSLSGASKEKALALVRQKTTLEEKIRELLTVPAIYSGRFSEPGLTHRLSRGEAMQKREIVAPGALEKFGSPLTLSTNTPEQQRRIQFAEWTFHQGKGLAARVIANRLWQFHFGEGIVSTPSDFGLNGAKPEHPELLDWLASSLIENGWRLKPIHKIILLSNTYRQGSGAHEKGLRIDAASRLLWRFPPRRLEAEALRDSILFISGNLDLRMGGPGFDLFEPNDNYVRVFNPKKEFGPSESRRMIYLTKHRMQLDDTFGAFDCPDAGQIAPKRNSSITPLQALNLLNSSFSVHQSALFARRVSKEAGTDPAMQVERAFQLAFNRNPAAPELARARELIGRADLNSFCRALFNVNELLYIF